MIVNRPILLPDIPTYIKTLETPVGPISVKWSENCLVSLKFEKKETGSMRLPKSFNDFLKDLHAYLFGHPIAFTVPLNLGGVPPFTEQVLRQCALIPYGTTCSYQELAMKVGNPNAARAVGQAMGRNPIPIVIPCHRVLQAQGRLGGYGGGLEWKRFFLQLEGVLHVT